MNLYHFVDNIPNFPKKGINFKDIGPILESPDALKKVKELFLDIAKKYKIDLIGGLDARGFLFSTLISENLRIGSFMIRKSNKLPGNLVEKSYSLEYGTSTLSVQKKRNLKNKNIVLIDDLLATGGTLKCAEDLVLSCQGNVVASFVLIELSSLMGRNLLSSPLHSLLQYNED